MRVIVGVREIDPARDTHHVTKTMVALQTRPCRACQYENLLMEAGTKKIENLKFKLG